MERKKSAGGIFLHAFCGRLVPFRLCMAASLELDFGQAVDQGNVVASLVVSGGLPLVPDIGNAQ